MRTSNFNATDKFLFIYPHPDDETFFNSGFFLFLNRVKIEYKVIILTQGGASTLKRKLGNRNLKDKRKSEFIRAMNTLKVSNYVIEDFNDGLISSTKGIKKYLTEVINNYKADYVVTYEPNGLYGHTDHVALTKFLQDILLKQKTKLIYSTITNKYKLEKGAKAMSILIPLPPHIISTWEISLTLFDWFTKLIAMYQYRSQFSFKKELLTHPTNFFEIRKEYYFIQPTKP